MPAIKPDRVLADLYKLRTFGEYKTGVHRPTFSDVDIAAREWTVDRMREAGLTAEVDGIGNILGRSPAKGRIMLSGSHLESQNHAGWLDGPLGVIYALEASRAIAESGSANGVDVVVLCDEEGHFGSFLGSRSFMDILKEEDIDHARDRTTGETMRDALKRAGYAGRPRVHIDTKRHSGFFEAHIEQGDTLEQSGFKIGVVTAIVAIWQYKITVTGEQNHAGTTGMARRRDAGLALVRLLAAIDKKFPEIAGPRSVWTTGRITLDPGGPSVIPGGAEALFQLRDADPKVLERMDVALQELCAAANKTERCVLKVDRRSASTPALMNEGLQKALDAAAEKSAPGKHMRMPSGAGHDAQYMAREIPAAMMFVPSIGGISHHWTENTSDEDIVLGAQVFADAIEAALKA
ncbi:putative hydrolase [Variibacter gotjawalensis]|uniref:Putative hydrolase n=1 Tax=Variibacter gotjawalensis TaxID=1333996 RepID=A0A0S3PPV7_9BRAD|nr:Zn-dependent hydrolase [Variibacter gotjawalensis]NIK48277.1 N-carbamoyl-L-amino-acid hydrolase [Variibacter gotjawalensis]RZS50149.1 N-carbamoyl-L-amino-acid hydrolase [Variibacter gotjawalensis]BAT57979.1 putative hydrolase [Variibacter gotjawalensis]